MKRTNQIFKCTHKSNFQVYLPHVAMCVIDNVDLSILHIRKEENGSLKQNQNLHTFRCRPPLRYNEHNCTHKESPADLYTSPSPTRVRHTKQTHPTRNCKRPEEHKRKQKRKPKLKQSFRAVEACWASITYWDINCFVVISSWILHCSKSDLLCVLSKHLYLLICSLNAEDTRRLERKGLS